MALTDQPYLPLYVQDWLSNNKLKICSPQAHGLMINIMCLMHKEDTYGKLLLKQKFKQESNICLQFASMLARLLPFDLLEIESALKELLAEKVLKIEGDYLVCQRMTEDAELSQKRAKSGKSGGESTTRKNKKIASKFAQAKTQANTENEIEYENVNEIDIKDRKEVQEERKDATTEPQPVDFTVVSPSAPWQADPDFQEAYAAWRINLRANHRQQLTEAEHMAVLRLLAPYTKAEALEALNKATAGKHKNLYPEHKRTSHNGSHTKDRWTYNEVLAIHNDPRDPRLMKDFKKTSDEEGGHWIFKGAQAGRDSTHAVSSETRNSKLETSQK